MISVDKSSPIQRVDHRREAARLRVLAKTATTGAIKARLLHQARQHEVVAATDPDVPTGPVVSASSECAK